MCRYAGRYYRDHFACFDCRKAFKAWQWKEPNAATYRAARLVHAPREVLCPVCAKPMSDMGWDFRAPRQVDSESWEILRRLRRAGLDFHSCGCGGDGLTPPKKLADLGKWLAGQRRWSQGELLAESFGRREAGRQAR